MQLPIGADANGPAPASIAWVNNPSWNGCQNKELLTLTKVWVQSLLQISHLWKRSRRWEGIAPFAFDCGQFHQRSDRLAFVIMGFNQDLATIPDAAPLANETCAAKKVTLNAKPVEPTHVAGGVNPPQVEVGWEDFKLDRLIEHIVIQMTELSISGRKSRFDHDGAFQQQRVKECPTLKGNIR